MEIDNTVSTGSFSLRLALIISVIVFSVLPLPVNAEYLPLTFDPTEPTELQTAQVVLRVGGCDFLSAFGPQERIITLSNQTLRVEVNGLSNAIIGDICNFPFRVQPIDLIPLEAGSYNVEIYQRSVSGPPALDLKATGSLTVSFGTSSTPQIIPANSTWSLIFATLIIGLLATLKFRR